MLENQENPECPRLKRAPACGSDDGKRGAQGAQGPGLSSLPPELHAGVVSVEVEGGFADPLLFSGGRPETA